MKADEWYRLNREQIPGVSFVDAMLIWDAAIEAAERAVDGLSPVAADSFTVGMAIRSIRRLSTSTPAAGKEGRS